MSSIAPVPIPTPPMLRRSAGLALLGLLMAASPSAQESQESSPSPLHPLVQAVLRQFPEIEGEVLEVQGGTVRIGLGARDGLPVEAELILFRRGRELRHPRTGQLLGHVEEPLGRVAVQAVREGDATARLLEPPPGAMPRPGDRVRTAHGPIRLGLLTLARPEAAGGGREDPLAAALASELEATGRFRPIFADRLKAGLPGEVLSADGLLGAGDRLAEFRRAFGVDYLLVATLRPAATETALEVRLLSLAQRRPLMTATELLGTLARLALAPRRPAPPSPRPEPDAIKAGGEPVPLARSAILRSFFASPRDRRRGDALPLAEIGSLGQFALVVDAAEPRAAGASPQLVLTDGESVSFYRLTPEGLRPEGSWRPAAGAILGVQFVALEGPDRLAVAVNRSLPGVGPASLILAAPPAPVRPLVDGIPAILLAVDEDGDGVKETLWGQGSEAGRLAAGRVVRYRYQEGRLTPEGAVEVPAGFRATGAVLASLTKGGGRELVYIDADRRLVVARGRIELWRSPVRVGGSDLEPNLFARDLDGDGVEEVLVPRNLAAGQGFAAGEVVILRRQEYELTLETLGPQFDGVVSGVAVLGRTPPSLLVAVARRADPRGGGGESRIFLARGS